MIGSKHFTFILFPVPSNNYINHLKTVFLKGSQGILTDPIRGILFAFPTFMLSWGHNKIFPEAT